MPRKRTYGLDIDTIAYATRVKAGSGVDILPENLKQINKFVIGLKKLGLWESIICWPLRSIHNAGKGSIIYSLGGLQVSNGTMVNLPTWQRDGVYFAPNSYANVINYANYPYNTGQFGLSIFSVINPIGWLPDGTSRDFALLGGWTYRPVFHLTTGVGGSNSMQLQKFIIDYNDTSLGAGFVNNYVRAFGAPSTNLDYYKNNFFFAGYSPGTTIQTCTFTLDGVSRENGASVQPVASYGITPTSPVQLRIGSMNASTNGLLSISALINITVNSTTMQRLRNLYKQTLGVGLNLPY